jgi:hypothetical protein
MMLLPVVSPVPGGPMYPHAHAAPSAPAQSVGEVQKPVEQTAMNLLGLACMMADIEGVEGAPPVGLEINAPPATVAIFRATPL